MDTSYSQHPGLNSEILIKGQMRFDNAFCFGNGKSRLNFDMPKGFINIKGKIILERSVKNFLAI